MSADENKISTISDDTNQTHQNSQNLNEPIDKQSGWKERICSNLKSEEGSVSVIGLLIWFPIIELILIIYRFLTSQLVKIEIIQVFACFFFISFCCILIFLLYKTWKTDDTTENEPDTTENEQQSFPAYDRTLLIHLIYLLILAVLPVILFLYIPGFVSVELLYFLILLAEATCIIVLYLKHNPIDEQRWFVRTNFYVVIGALFSITLAIVQLFFADSLITASASWAFSTVATLITVTYMKQIYDEKIYPLKDTISS